MVVQVGALAGQPAQRPHLVVVADGEAGVPALGGVEAQRDRPAGRVGLPGGDGEQVGSAWMLVMAFPRVDAGSRTTLDGKAYRFSR